MPGVSKEQIAAAKQMTAIEFLRRFRPNELVRSGSRGEFQLREHDSFKINGESSIWHWKSRDIGGKSALDYLIKVEGMKFVDAVLALCDECPGYIPPPPQPKKRPEFILPPAAMNNRRVFAYVDDMGQLGVEWDNGSALSLIPGEDSFSKVSAPEKEKQKRSRDLER